MLFPPIRNSEVSRLLAASAFVFVSELCLFNMSTANARQETQKQPPALIPRLVPLLSEKGTPVFRPADALRFMAAAAIIRIYNHEKPDAPIITAGQR